MSRPSGVGVEDLDRQAGGARGDVAGLDGPAAGHVLDRADQSDDAHRQPQPARPGTGSAMTAAAPLMSNFISSMPGGSLSEMPPVSKVTPLPTSTTGGLSDFSERVPARCSSTMKRGGCALPCDTAEQASHLFLLDRRLVQNLDAQRRVLLGKRPCLVRQVTSACRHWRADWPDRAAGSRHRGYGWSVFQPALGRFHTGFAYRSGQDFLQGRRLRASWRSSDR